MKNDIVLIGRPGSGKSTIGKALADHYNMIYISSGDIARKLAEDDKTTKKQLCIGHLAPEDLMRDELKHTARLAHDNGNSVIFDGFPRFLGQDEFFVEHMSQSAIYVHIDIPRHIAVERLLNRGRNDDTADIISDRMKFFVVRTLPILNLHHDAIEVDGEGDINDVIKNVIERIDEFVNSSKA